MPYLDVNGLLVDPMIAGEAFTVVRRLEVVSSTGNVQTVNTYLPARGSIGPVAPDQLNRLPEQQEQSKSLSVVTAFRLMGAAQVAGTRYQPDLVLWKGDFYVVTALDDYTQYGAGMVQAMCTSIDWIDNAPAAPTAAFAAKLAASFNLPGNIAATPSVRAPGALGAVFTLPGNIAATPSVV
jgi:hypothetical protein